MNRPTIGVLPLFDEKKDSYWMLPGYMNGLIDAGAVPVMLPLTNDQTILTQIAKQYDGFLFTGGHDVSPQMYKQEPLSCCDTCCEERDEMEHILFSLVYDLDKPIFGICRGIQLINVLLGGTLFQDLPTQRASMVEHHQQPPYELPAHHVDILPNTPLSHLLDKKSIAVNSYHHQAIHHLSQKLAPMAYSEDTLVEAVYAPDKSYLWAVQWHPEFSFQQDENSRKLFRSFVNAAAKHVSQ